MGEPDLGILCKRRERKRKREGGKEKKKIKLRSLASMSMETFRCQRERLKQYFIDLVEEGTSNGNEFQGREYVC